MKYTFIYKIYCGEMTPRVGRVEIKTAQTYTDAKNDFERLIEIENNDIINEEEFIMVYECEELRPKGELVSGF